MEAIMAAPTRSTSAIATSVTRRRFRISKGRLSGVAPSLNASFTLALAAWRAGKIPNRTPVAIERAAAKASSLSPVAGGAVGRGAHIDISTLEAFDTEGRPRRLFGFMADPLLSVVPPRP